MAAPCLIGIPGLVYLLHGTRLKKDGIGQQDQQDDAIGEGEFSMEG